MYPHNSEFLYTCTVDCSASPLREIPFLGSITTHTCDKHGVELSVSDVLVSIPPGAIPDGVLAHIEMGVALYGPFVFAENHQQVSPILWFCIQEDIDLLLPITYTLPHIIVDINHVQLSFAKANHFGTDRSRSTQDRESSGEVNTFFSAVFV